MHQKIETPVIGAINKKGGVGKTELIMQLSEFLVLMQNKNILGIDLEGQSNYSDQAVGMEYTKTDGWYPPPHPDYSPGLDVEKRSSIADIFYGKSVLPYPSWIQSEKGGSLEVALANQKKLEKITDTFQKSVGQPVNKDVHNSLYNFLYSKDDNDPESLSVRDMYDGVLVDIGPSKSALFMAALRALTHVIIPFKPNRRDVQGIAPMLSAIWRENDSRPNSRQPIKLIGILPNMVEIPLQIGQRKFLNEVVEQHSDILMPKETWLHSRAAYTNRDLDTANPRSIFELPDSSPAKQEAYNLCKHISDIAFGVKNA